MSWYAVYEISTGKLQSIGSVEPVGLPPGLGYKAVGDSRPYGVWDPVALAFVASNTSPDPVTRKGFMLLFTQQERIQLRTQAQVDGSLDDFIEIIKISDEIRLDDPDTMAGLNMLRNKGIISQGRVDQILAGVRP